MRRLLLHAMLLFLLAFSQQGALVHQIGHYAHSGHGTADTRQPVPGQEKTCHLCLAYAQVGSAAPSSGPVLLLQALAYHHGAAAATASCPADRVAYRNRGPPETA